MGLGNLFGAFTGGTGTITSSSQGAISKEAAQCWGLESTRLIAAQYQQQNAWMTTLASIIGTYGIIKQMDLLERQVDLQETVVGHSERYLQLAERAYQEVTLDAYTCQKSLFTRYETTLDQCVDQFMAESKRLITYDPQYELQEGRALSSVQGGIDRARKRRARQRGKYSTGQCCFEETWFAMETVRLEVEAANHAYRFEDDRKLRLDEWYWQRFTAGAQLVENYRAHVVSGVNQGVTNVSSGLNAIGNAVQSLRQSSNDLAGGLRDQASFFGSVSNGAFRLAGYNSGYGSPPTSMLWGTGQNALFNSIAGGGLAGGGGGIAGGVNPFSSGGGIGAPSMGLGGGFFSGLNNMFSGLVGGVVGGAASTPGGT